MTTVLTRVTDVLPEIIKRAEETDRDRRIPADLLDALRPTGALRMFAPTAHGGNDLALPDVLAVVEALSAADASVGWTVAQHAVAQLIVRHFPAATVARLYAAGPDLLAAGAVAPKGRAARSGDGWQVSGQWPFVTGAPQADWFYLQCLETVDNAPRLDGTGVPAMRLALLPAAEVSVLDTWHTAGLRGTASRDVRASRVTCRQEFTCAFDAETDDGDPLVRLPARDLGGLFVAAVVVGNAAGALDDVVALADGGKRPAFSPRRLADSPAFHQRLGEAHLRLRAARGQLRAEAARAWGFALRPEPMGPLDHAVLRATGPAVVAVATAALDTAYQLGGGSVVYDRSPLQRRMRDGHVATQHFSVGTEFFSAVGAVLAGGDPGVLLR
ncbi:acyl-CoA dehydrogenase family protein [Luedemannella helvata]|uniref:Flavin-dependent monooxygenase n=1 Tax=Luedemannella helvata TaxID=349315 RepID=A0ABN2KWL6_9ACTN